jgi:porin
LLADPSGSGIAAMRRGDFGIYGVVEQQIYRPSGGDATSGVTVFSRLSGSPSDRNLIDFFVDGGIVFAGLVPQRPNDKFGASAMYSRFSNSVRAFERDQIAFTGIPTVVQDFEANLELTYSAQIIPGWTVQPVLTHIWHPNGDRTRNATVTGVRSYWQF